MLDQNLFQQFLPDVICRWGWWLTCFNGVSWKDAGGSFFIGFKRQFGKPGLL
jgi:hypothetical protein